jgi:hypothetical protein
MHMHVHVLCPNICDFSYSWLDMLNYKLHFIGWQMPQPRAICWEKTCERIRMSPRGRSSGPSAQSLGKAQFFMRSCVLNLPA